MLTVKEKSRLTFRNKQGKKSNLVVLERKILSVFIYELRKVLVKCTIFYLKIKKIFFYLIKGREKVALVAALMIIVLLFDDCASERSKIRSTGLISS